RLYQSQNANTPNLDFGHNAFYQLGEDIPWLLASYHPSQQNTLTGRLTQDMFDSIWERVKDLIV
ncbi:MAG: hypothetical protein SCH68_12915, partial [Brevefilum sp.]|nr:hypothetical protein [Brevefilum sp.]